MGTAVTIGEPERDLPPHARMPRGRTIGAAAAVGDATCALEGPSSDATLLDLNLDGAIVPGAATNRPTLTAPVKDPPGAGVVAPMEAVVAGGLALDDMRLDGMLADVVRASASEMFVYDAQTLRFLMVSAGALSNLGMTAQAALGATFYDHIPNPLDPEVERRIGSLRRQGSGHTTVTTSLRRGDGSWYPVEAQVQLIDGPRPVFFAVVTDLSRLGSARERADLAQARLIAAMETLPDAFVLYDADDRLVHCNARYRDYYPQSAHAMVVGARFEDILRAGLERGEYAVEPGGEEAWLAKRLNDHRAADQTVEQRLSDGRWLRILERRTPEGGRVGLRIDVTALKDSTTRAERAEQRLRDAIDGMPAAFWMFDPSDRLVLTNRGMDELFAQHADLLKPGTTYEAILRGSLARGRLRAPDGDADAFVASQMSRRVAGLSYEGEYRLDDGRWLRSWNRRMSDGGYVGFRIDVTDAKRDERDLRRAASTDPLTGLLNRRGVSERMAGLASRGERVAVMHIDLDKFKSVNDVMGHEAGDHVLTHCATLLRRETRQGDLIARVGGDEFLVCCPAPDDTSVLGRLADRLVAQLSRPIPFGDKTCRIGASVGIALWDAARAPDPEPSLLDADTALKAAKDGGRGRHAFFVPQMRSEAELTATLGAELMVALERDELRAHLQPQIEVATGRVTGFEALVRWDHPTRGLLRPDQFLFAADAANLIDRVDGAVVELACRAASRLGRAGLEAPSVSVNLSTSRLSDPTLVEQLKWNVEINGLEPSQIVIEILESTLLDDRTANVVENVTRMSQEGFQIELDDFGTGHTAITSLVSFPVDRIKIDRSLVDGIDTKPDLRMITAALINLGRELGKGVLCEGVETEAELAVLRRLGCAEVQGYYFAKPMPLDDLFDWLEARSALHVRAAE